MPDRHKHGGLSWHPPGELSAWAREEAARRGVKLSAVLTDALAAYAEACGHVASTQPVESTPAPQVESTRAQVEPTRKQQPRPKERTEGKPGPTCPHPKARVLRGLCRACGTYIGE